LQAPLRPEKRAAALYATLTGHIAAGGKHTLLKQATISTGDFISIHMSEFGVYAQDTWRVRPNITLTFSLRNEALLLW
jgi:hypothetical protein